MQLDAWRRGFAPATSPELKMERRLSPLVRAALARSYVRLEATAIEDAAVELAGVLTETIPSLYQTFGLDRAVAKDFQAAEIVKAKQVARSPN